MEFITFLLVFILLIIFLTFKGKLFDKISLLEHEIKELQCQISLQSIKPEAPVVPPSASVEKTVIKEVPKPEKDYWESNFKVVDEPVIKNEPTAIEESSIKKEKVFEKWPTEEDLVISSTLATQKETYQSQTSYTLHEEKPGFFERNPDLEKFIGENLVSKIGIAILVLAIAYFVKFAIDNDWIGPVGRVGVGVLCGGILTGIAHRLRNSYKAFSSILIGGGLAVFYFTITLAHQQFHLFSQTIAFVIMIVITAFAVTLALLYDRQELAIIALVGGFGSPFMVSNGSGNYVSLFTYLIILNAGLLVLAYNKAWRLLNLLAFIFAILIFSGWLFTLPYGTNGSTYKGGLLFATIFYLLFFAINIAHNIKENRKFIASDFGILLANTSLYFGTGLYLITEMQANEYRGSFSAAMGLFNLAASYFLFRKRKVDTNILYLLIGITLTFISLTAPMQLHGHFITLFWASEAVLLFWLYQKSRISIIQLTSGIIWIAMLISLLMDWSAVYGDNTSALKIVLNKGFITGVYCAAATYIFYLLVKKEMGSVMIEPVSFIAPLMNGFRFVSIGLLFVTGLIEISYQFKFHYPGQSIYLLYVVLYINCFILLFLFISQRLKTLENEQEVSAFLVVAAIVLYLVTIPHVYQLQSAMLQQQQHTQHFLAYWTSIIFTGIFIYSITSILRKQNNLKGNVDFFTWMICAVVVTYLSVEVHHVMNQFFYSKTNTIAEIERVYIKTGLPILWGLCSFVFMWLGMNHKYKTLRIISLSLFLITLLKLFIFDLSNIPVAGKISAFFCLGVLLLVVSFMYQRLKKIIIDDEKKTAE